MITVARTITHMILVVVALLAGLTLADKNASDYYLSDLMCEILDISEDDCSLRTLEDNVSEYCDTDKSFFTKEELDDFIDKIKSYYDDIEEELKSWNDKLDLFSKAEDLIDKCGDKCSKLQKYLDKIEELVELIRDFNIDTDKLSYAISNSFNLGIMCLAADPRGFYDDNVVKIKDNIVDYMASYCEDGIDMMKDYVIELVDIINDFGDEDLINKNKIEETLDKLDKESLCEDAADKVILSSGLYEKITDALFGIFESAYEEIVNAFNRIYDYVYSNLSDYLDILGFDINEEIDEAMNFVLKFSKPTNMNNITNNDAEKYIEYSSDGFDVVEASKNNPEYKVMVAESFPSAISTSSSEDSLSSNKSSDLAWWIILVAVLAAAIVIAAAVSLTVYFVVIKPKKEAEEEKGKNDVAEDDLCSTKSETNRESTN